MRALALLCCLAAPALAQPATDPGAGGTLSLLSPDGRTTVRVGVDRGVLRYAVSRDGRALVLPSRLGFAFRGAAPLDSGLRLVDTTRAAVDTTWTQPWGEVARVRDHHRALRVRVAESAGARRTFAVEFRAFDDGVGFRYELPAQPNLRDFAIQDERTEFALADDARAWWIPANRPVPDRYEMLYASSPVSMLDTVRTPLALEFQGGPIVVLHEADLSDYAAMDLAYVGRNVTDRTLRPALAPWADGVKVRGRTPFATPWRTIQIADRAEQLAPSVLGLNLNPPSRIADAGWIRPMKYDGIWWGMHVGLHTWPQGPRHGATTERAKQYVDFAAANGLGGTLVEGWNVGWDGDWIGTYGRDFSFTRAYPDYDLRAVAAYARERGVSLIVHNETAMGIANYERQLEEAFRLYRSLGVTAIKSGYVNDRTREGHAHTGQYMVRHFRRVIETAARYGITVNAHEPVMDTGERRTWPNMLSREGARGQEYNAGGGGNPPEHETILFFTRLLAGPLDYTPGIFDLAIRRPTGTPRAPHESRVRTTLAKQLALYVVLWSPVQMAADVIESYEGEPAFRFVRDVAVDWDTTRVLSGRIGDHVAVARRAKGRDEWFLGAITDEEGRTLEVPLDFLPAGRRWVAETYADAPDAHFLTNPRAIAIASRAVASTDRLRLVLAPGGGQAIRFRPE
ncbi:glycoside hydrolase family 97 protein [Roseisolibacter sp. H3M3-2]|uniref:glycoside hydrolase family 97 protein n=1 Tax=Roseisolibacter sp. H3M3-2 TaxID=3031323 RepID=UPI0023DBB262|nr:glycoside hydrolase family 97 protein [Roseisolibacter sp. H3M3-2]MDF1504228.1 glycoside hydrolase family 97 protein [Roseisolibacter sp. H3M3-2]